MISRDHQFFFVRVPKTAGKSVRHALKDLEDENLGHEKAQQLSERFPDEWKSYFKFTFVRNPWDRVVSHYHYYKNCDEAILRESPQRKRKLRRLARTIDFREWVRDKHPTRQLDFLRVNGEICVDFIGRFERLRADWRKVCSQLNISGHRLPHHNKSTHDHYSQYYDEETIAFVADTYREEIEYFGYAFERVCRVAEEGR